MTVIIVHFVDLAKQIKITTERAAQALDNTNTYFESSAVIRYMEDLQTSRSTLLKGVYETKGTWQCTSLTTTAQEVRLRKILDDFFLQNRPT